MEFKDSQTARMIAALRGTLTADLLRANEETPDGSDLRQFGAHAIDELLGLTRDFHGFVHGAAKTEDELQSWGSVGDQPAAKGQ